MFCEFIHIAETTRAYAFMEELHSIVYLHILLTHSSIVGLLGCFLILDVMTIPEITMGVNLSLPLFLSVCVHICVGTYMYI